jgi:hypothetical protein
MALGESLHADKRALAAQDCKDGHQQHPPLGKDDALGHPAVQQGLEEVDEIACNNGRGGALGSQWSGLVPANDTLGATPQPGLPGQTSNITCGIPFATTGK